MRDTVSSSGYIILKFPQRLYRVGVGGVNHRSVRQRVVTTDELHVLGHVSTKGTSLARRELSLTTINLGISLIGCSPPTRQKLQAFLDF